MNAYPSRALHLREEAATQIQNDQDVNDMFVDFFRILSPIFRREVAQEKLALSRGSRKREVEHKVSQSVLGLTMREARKTTPPRRIQR